MDQKHEAKNIEFVQFDADGRIVVTASIPESGFNHLYKDSKDIARGVGVTAEHYVKDGQIIDRPTQATTLDGPTLNNLPIPCQIQINGQTYACQDDHAELGFDLPGVYTITVTAWPFLDAEFTYEN